MECVIIEDNVIERMTEANELAESGELKKAYKIYDEIAQSVPDSKLRVLVLHNMLLLADTITSIKKGKKKRTWAKKCEEIARELAELCENYHDEMLSEALAHFMLGKVHLFFGRKEEAKKELSFAYELAQQAEFDPLCKDIARLFFKLQSS